MISSPSFNPVVVAMVFVLFPLPLAAMRLVVPAVLLAALPLLVRENELGVRRIVVPAVEDAMAPRLVTFGRTYSAESAAAYVFDVAVDAIGCRHWSVRGGDDSGVWDASSGVGGWRGLRRDTWNIASCADGPGCSFGIRALPRRCAGALCRSAALYVGAGEHLLAECDWETTGLADEFAAGWGRCAARVRRWTRCDGGAYVFAVVQSVD